MNTEEWKMIPRYAGFYEASSLGRIRRVKEGVKGSKAGRVLSPATQNNGYLRLVLCVGGVKKDELVHRLIAEAFLGSPPAAGMQVAHGDGDPANNEPRNLRWETPAGNMADTLRHGTRSRGEHRPLAKLTEQQVMAIRAALGTQKDIAKKYGVSRQLIGDIKAGKRWTHVN